MPKLIANIIQTPDGTILQSHSVHDYVAYRDKNGEVYVNDGGIAYARRSLNTVPYTEMSVFDIDPHTTAREYFTWGTYGKDGDQPLRRIKLKDLEDGHIQAILDTQHQVPSHIRNLFEMEQYHRANS
jgi:hypothetical protein